MPSFRCYATETIDWTGVVDLDDEEYHEAVKEGRLNEVVEMYFWEGDKDERANDTSFFEFTQIGDE